MNDLAEATIARMPRGGPDASWLDRQLQTQRLEYTDRYDVDDTVKQQVITALDRIGTLARAHDQNARVALEVVADIDHPRILEIGAGHGKLSARILELHPSATMTISDLDPTSVANIADSALGADPRVQTQVVDATAIDAEDDSYDLVVFAQAFHHLPPATAFRAIAEATRVSSRFLVIDLARRSPWVFAATIPVMFPAVVAAGLAPSLRPLLHDGFISGLRAYSRSAFVALGTAVDAGMTVDFLPAASRWALPPSTTVLYTRPNEIAAATVSSGGQS